MFVKGELPMTAVSPFESAQPQSKADETPLWEKCHVALSQVCYTIYFLRSFVFFSLDYRATESLRGSIFRSKVNFARI